MELILWRHAEAEPGRPDLPDHKRALTPKGRKQAARMGEWLDRQLPGSCRILSSPAVRTMQTAEALDRKYKTLAALAPDARAQAVLEAIQWDQGTGAVLVVGHQPTLGQVASLLIAGQEQDWMLRKGALLWIAQKQSGGQCITYIKAALTADMAGK